MIKFLNLFLVFALLAAVPLQAQKGKKGKKDSDDDGDKKAAAKEWKNKMKAMDPLKFKAIYEEYGTLQGEYSRSQKQIGVLKNQLNDKERILVERSEKAEALVKELEAAKAQAEANKETETQSNEVVLSPVQSQDFSKGIVYQVETGAKRDPSLAEYQQYGNFWQTYEGGEKRYSLAYFRDYWEADAFKNVMRKIGVADAYVYSYKDGRPIGIQDARKADRK
jgi:vacuolar-type H+-ATPase subunit I/STV1